MHPISRARSIRRLPRPAPVALALLLVAMALATVPCLAVPGAPVRVSYRFGLDGVYRPGRFAPVSVEIRYDGVPQELEACWSEGEDVTLQRVPVGPGTNKQLELYVRRESRRRSGQRKLEVRAQDGVVLAQGEERGPTSRIDNGKYVALVVTQRGLPAAIGGLTGFTRVGLPRNYLPAGVECRTIPPARLPEHFLGLDPADIVVIGDGELSSAPSSAIDSLIAWTALGGMLVVSGGVNPGRLLGSELAKILPVELSGRTVEIESLSSLDRMFPTSTESPVAPNVPGLPLEARPGLKITRPFTVPEARLRDPCRAILEEDSASVPRVPLVAMRRLGEGWVVYIAFDLDASPFAYTGRNAEKQLWRHLIDRACPRRTELDRDRDRSGTDRFMLPRYQSSNAFGLLTLNAGSRATTIMVALFVAVYWLVMCPAQFIVLHRRRALHLGWITTPIIALLFSALAFGIGYFRQGGRAVQRQIAFFTGSADGSPAISDVYTRVYAFTERSHTVQSSRTPALTELAENDDDDPAEMVVERNQVRPAPTAVHMCSERTFHTRSVGPLPLDISADLTVNRGGPGTTVKGVIHNRSDRTLLQAALVLGTESCEIDTIDPQSSRRLDAVFASLLGASTWGRRHPLPRFDRILASKGFHRVIRNPGAPGSLELVAVTAGPPSPVALLEPPVEPAERLAIVNLRLPCRFQGLAQVSIPLDHVRLSSKGSADFALSTVTTSGPTHFQAWLFPAPRPRVKAVTELQLLSSSYSFPGTIKLKNVITGHFEGVPAPSQVAYGHGIGRTHWSRQAYSSTIVGPERYVKLPEGLVEVLVESTRSTHSSEPLPDLGFSGTVAEVDPEESE